MPNRTVPNPRQSVTVHTSLSCPYALPVGHAVDDCPAHTLEAQPERLEPVGETPTARAHPRHAVQLARSAARGAPRLGHLTRDAYDSERAAVYGTRAALARERRSVARNAGQGR